MQDKVEQAKDYLVNNIPVHIGSLNSFPIITDTDIQIRDKEIEYLNDIENRVTDIDTLHEVCNELSIKKLNFQSTLKIPGNHPLLLQVLYMTYSTILLNIATRKDTDTMNSI